MTGPFDPEGFWRSRIAQERDPAKRAELEELKLAIDSLTAAGLVALDADGRRYLTDLGRMVDELPGGMEAWMETREHRSS